MIKKTSMMFFRKISLVGFEPFCWKIAKAQIDYLKSLIFLRLKSIKSNKNLCVFAISNRNNRIKAVIFN
jgi:hypothetical protein